MIKRCLTPFYHGLANYREPGLPEDAYDGSRGDAVVLAALLGELVVWYQVGVNAAFVVSWR